MQRTLKPDKLIKEEVKQLQQRNQQQPSQEEQDKQYIL